MSDLVPLDAVPALLVRERNQLASLTSPAEVADVERRAAAIAELTRRAGLAVPIQNEATFLRAEALERLAVLVDEARDRNDVPVQGRHVRDSDMSVGVPRQRIAEGRALARTGVLAEIEQEINRISSLPEEKQTTISMNDILKRAKRSEREQALRQQTAEREAQARQAIKAAPERPYLLHHGSLADWRPQGVASIITDPPYVGDSIPLYEHLRDFAVDVLPQGGPLVVMTWQAILPNVIRALEHPELAYRWTICWRYANTENTVDHARRVFDCWKPILVYHKGAMPSDAPMMRDEIANKETDKGFHEWGQSVDGFERLVKTFSQPGDVVCDPFLGGGTTAIAALAQARRFVGCDVDERAIETSAGRLAA